MDDRDRRAIVLSEHNAAAAEGYHKALVKMQADNKELKAALLERDSTIARLKEDVEHFDTEMRHREGQVARLREQLSRIRAVNVVGNDYQQYKNWVLAVCDEALKQSGDTAGGE